MMSIDYKEAYLKWLSENIEQDQIGEDVYRVTLPYLNRNNDYIDLYVVRREDGLYRITDDGWTISDLSLSGFKLKLSTSRRTILDSVLASYGVSLSDESEMFVESSLDELALKKHMLSQCMLKVDDMFYLSKTNVQSVFSEDVRQFLDLKNVRYLESVSFVGKSKLPANYDFGIPKSKSILSVLSR